MSHLKLVTPDFVPEETVQPDTSPQVFLLEIGFVGGSTLQVGVTEDLYDTFLNATYEMEFIHLPTSKGGLTIMPSSVAYVYKIPMPTGSQSETEGNDAGTN